MAGLEIGKRALLSHQVNLQTIGHNIANVNTPGYSRQRVTISSTYPSETAAGLVGTGVTVEDIRHVRDLFLGDQYRQENKTLGQWTYKQKILSQVESLFAEPNDNTLADRLNEFWDSWDDLSKNPNATNREGVIGAARLLTESFHTLARDINKLRDSVDADLATYTSQINQTTGEIAALNRQIVTQEVDGSRASDLRDRRNQLIDELSSLLDVNTIEDANGAVRVMVGAMEIVTGLDTIPIATRILNDNGRMTHELVWRNTAVELKNVNGELKGLLDTRDKIIPGYLQELGALARTLVEQVNAVHRTGYGLDGSTGLNFFDSRYTDAESIRINEDLVAAPHRIAASASGEVGDGSITLAVQNLRNERVMASGTTTINDYYSSLVGQLGVEAHQATSFAENSALLVHQIESARQAVQGVSLDEEMANMVKFQHAYDAAARVITTMDEALDTVISRMGVVGR